MKIVVIEDGDRAGRVLNSCLKAAGHEVFLFKSFRSPSNPSGDDLRSLIKKIKQLNADRVLVDHMLGTSFTGADIVAGLSKMDPTKFISISTDPRKYCRREFAEKDSLPSSDHPSGGVFERFIEVVTK